METDPLKWMPEFNKIMKEQASFEYDQCIQRLG